MQEIICDHLWVCLSLHTVPQVRNPGTWKSAGLRFINCALKGLAASICESGKEERAAAHRYVARAEVWSGI